MKRLKKTTVLFGVVAFCTSGIVLAGGDLELGKNEYNAKCTVCHGPTGKGDGPYVDQLKAGSSDITQLAKKNNGVFPQTDVLMLLDGRSEVQAHGPREMPIWGEVFLSEGPSDKLPKDREPYVDKRLWALIEYLKTLQVK